jgi:hypothetical protein
MGTDIHSGPQFSKPAFVNFMQTSHFTRDWMKQHRTLPLYWNFYKRLLLNNLVISILLSVLSFPFFLKTFAVSYMSAGFLLSLLYHEFTHQTEYYFYYNKGLSKLNLISVTALINILIGSIVLIIYYGSVSGG